MATKPMCDALVGYWALELVRGAPRYGGQIVPVPENRHAEYVEHGLVSIQHYRLSDGARCGCNPSNVDRPEWRLYPDKAAYLAGLAWQTMIAATGRASFDQASTALVSALSYQCGLNAFDIRGGKSR